METPKKPNTAVIAVIVIALIAVTAGAVVYSRKQTTMMASTSSMTSTMPSTTGGTSSMNTNMSSSYKDGQYSQTADYYTPDGQASIGVTLTLKNNVIESVSATGSPAGRESEQYQNDFLSSYKSQVVGKNINAVSLSRVAGSSLTTNGFNNAIEIIKQDAINS